MSADEHPTTSTMTEQQQASLDVATEPEGDVSRGSMQAHYPADEENVESAAAQVHSGGHETAENGTGVASHDELSSQQESNKEASHGKDGQSRRKEAPACLLHFRDNVEACSHRVQAWSDAKETQARERKVRRREETDGGVRVEDDGRVVEPKGDNIVQRKGIIVLVAIILSWVYVAFVWRICVDAIRKESRATATRSEGIGLLVAFNVIWLMTVWSYIKVVCTGPGHVRDYVPISEPPTSPQEDEFQPPYQLLPPVQQHAYAQDQQQQQAYVHNHKQRYQQQFGSPQQASSMLPTETSVDSTLAATLGPIGVGMVARGDEATKMKQQLEHTTTYPTGQHPNLYAPQQLLGVALGTQPQQQYNTAPMAAPAPVQPQYPEPMRIPRTGKPLLPSNTYCYRCRRHKPPRSHHCRHCGTCVLKMDHHCPWVGGCVGARNHKFFFNFLQWVVLLAWLVLIVNAVMFNRGLRRAVWSVDGYMISLFPIAAIFALFTTALLITHAYLFALNLSTIEHMGYDRQKTRENILIDNWTKERCEREGTPKPNFFGSVRERNAMKAKWADFWGKPKTENNPWWLDGRHAPRLVTLPTADEVDRAKRDEPAVLSTEVSHEAAAAAGKPLNWLDALGTNWREAMGDNVLGWILPIGRGRNADGRQYEGNWRFGPLGEWTPRQQWAVRLQAQPAKEG